MWLLSFLFRRHCRRRAVRQVDLKLRALHPKKLAGDPQGDLKLAKICCLIKIARSEVAAVKRIAGMSPCSMCLVWFFTKPTN